MSEEDKAIEVLNGLYIANLLDLDETIRVNKALDLAIYAVERLKPRKWINWTDDYKDYCTCPVCAYGEEGEVLFKDKTPFCPVCGTNLKG